MADITKVSPSTEEAQPTGDVKEREVATKNDDETKKPTKVNMAGYFELFRYGDALDITYMLFGSLMAIGYGQFYTRTYVEPPFHLINFFSSLNLLSKKY